MFYRDHNDDTPIPDDVHEDRIPAGHADEPRFKAADRVFRARALAGIATWDDVRQVFRCLDFD